MISLFVRSYDKDFEWLEHSIRSMKKNLIGITEKILVLPDTTEYVPSNIRKFFDKTYYTQETHEGYVQQQIDKVRAYKYCKNNYILFSDSDCIYYDPFDANQRLDTDKIILPKTRYEILPKEPQIWKEITYLATGIDTQYEYMRCFPIVHHRTVLEYLDTNEQYSAYLTIVKNRELSEFNALGAIAETYFSHLYKFVDTEIDQIDIPTAKQYWSWGGINLEILNELKGI